MLFLPTFGIERLLLIGITQTGAQAPEEFTACELPDGWRAAPLIVNETEQTSWLSIIDNKERIRGAAYMIEGRGLFAYGPTSYAYSRYTGTFEIDTQFIRPAVSDFESGENIWSGPPVKTDTRNFDEQIKQAIDAAFEWLKENRPDYLNPALYWE